MKKVAIMLRPDKLDSGKDAYISNLNIANVLIKRNVIPVGVFPPYTEYLYGKKINDIRKLTDEEKEKLFESLKDCDGLLLQGGDDFYNQDLLAIKYFYDLNKPILGICLGMQTMGYFLGGTEERIGNTSHKSAELYVHDALIKKDSLIYEIMGEDQFKVNSRHNYKINISDNYVTGYSDDGIVEVIEEKKHKFFLGVQWHPEDMVLYNYKMEKIFDKFVEEL